MKRRTKIIADIAMFTAIGCVLNFISMPVVGKFGRISFVYTYCYLAGMLLGPWNGAASAFAADTIAALIQIPVNGPWMPLISVSNAVMAFIPGLLFRYCGRSFAAKFSISVALDFIICTLILNPLGELPLFNIFPYAFPKSLGAAFGITSPFLMIMLGKAIMQPVWICLNCFITIFVYKRVYKAFKRDLCFKKTAVRTELPLKEYKEEI